MRYYFLFAFLAMIACSKAPVPQPTQSNSNYQVKVVLNVTFNQADSIKWQGNNNVGYFKIPSKEIDFTLPGTNGATYQSSFSALEVGSNINTDNISMQIYVNGTLTYTQNGMGWVQQNISY